MTLQLFKIASVTVGSAGATTMEFTNIPQGYTDLKLAICAQTTYAGGADAYLRFQGGTGSTNYSWKKLQRDGASLGSYGATGIDQASPWTLKGDVGAGTFANTEIYIPNYSVSGVPKSFTGETAVENNATASYNTLSTNVWSITNPITDIVLSVASGFKEYSTATLYGIL